MRECRAAGLGAPGVLPTGPAGDILILGRSYCLAGAAVKGVVFNLLEEVVVAHHGQSAWEKLLDDAGVEGAYTSLGSYPDAQMTALVAAGAALLGLPAHDVLRWFGREAMPALARRYPAFFRSAPGTRAFLLTLNSLIHPEVRKIYPGADVPVFDFSDAPDGALLMGYNSHRRLCALAQGFVEGAGRYFSEGLRFTHLQCVHRGDVRCMFKVEISAGAPAALAA